MKNQIHGLLASEGMEGVKGSLQSKKGRKRVLDTLKASKNGLVAQPLFDTIDNLLENIKSIEDEIRVVVEGDRMVKLLLTIPGCGEIIAWTIRAYTDDINRFSSPKKYASFAGLAPWVQNSNEVVRHGRITKRGPKELRTALVQLVVGLRRMKKKTLTWRLMQRYEMMKSGKGSGKSIIATARKMATIIWHMLIEDVEFDVSQMVDRKLGKESDFMSRSARVVKVTLDEGKEKPAVMKVEDTRKKKTDVVRKKERKVG
jgi:transposase